MGLSLDEVRAAPSPLLKGAWCGSSRMSNLERWHDDENPSDGEQDVEDDMLPDFLRPTAQSQRRTEAARRELSLIEQHEAMKRDAGLADGRGYSIVDQSQFRNTQIGHGYQHRNVVRQPTVATASFTGTVGKEKIIDNTPAAIAARRETKKRRRDEEKARDAANLEAQTAAISAYRTEAGLEPPRKEKKHAKERKQSKASKKHRKQKKDKKHKKDKKGKKSKKNKKRSRRDSSSGSSGDSSSSSSDDSDDGRESNIESTGKQHSDRLRSDEDGRGLPGPSLPSVALEETNSASSTTQTTAPGSETDPVEALVALGELRQHLIKGIAALQAANRHKGS